MDTDERRLGQAGDAEGSGGWKHSTPNIRRSMPKGRGREGHWTTDLAHPLALTVWVSSRSVFARFLTVKLVGQMSISIGSL
jgi:hypothetical protein